MCVRATVSGARAALHAWRMGKERKSASVVAIAKWLLPEYASKLGSEGIEGRAFLRTRSSRRKFLFLPFLSPLTLSSPVYDIYEQVCLAALDCNEPAVWMVGAVMCGNSK